MKPTYIVAGTYDEFRTYVQEKYEYWTKQAMLMPDYKYVAGVDGLRGLSNIKGFYIGTYNQRKDIDEIRQQILIIKGKSQSKYLIHVNGILQHQNDYDLNEVDDDTIQITLPKGLIGQLSITSIQGKHYTMPIDCSLMSNTWMIKL